MDSDCEWTVEAPLGMRIQFDLHVLSIESHEDCNHDYVEVWDHIWDHLRGRATSNHLLARFCDSTKPEPVMSSGHIATVVFHSDHSVSDKGFHITWAAAPGE